MPNTLFLRLEGPLQSWGERGRWSVRDSASEPTKSGVIGLLACALGEREDAPMRALSEGVRMAVRCDADGVQLTDYHTIGGGYSEAMLLTAEGKAKKSNGQPHTELSSRDYLADASFLVVLQGDPALIERLARAVRAPVWPIFLGRKSCPPSAPIYAGSGDFPSLETALLAGPYRRDAAQPTRPLNLRAVVESDAQRGQRRRDAVLSRKRRRYGPRYTEQIQVTFFPSLED
jgi:CRISPR system Cascade subunit CasD